MPIRGSPPNVELDLSNPKQLTLAVAMALISK